MNEKEAEQMVQTMTYFNEENGQGDPKDNSVSGNQVATVVDAVDGARQKPVTATADGVDGEHSGKESGKKQREKRCVSQVSAGAGAKLAVSEAAEVEIDGETAPTKSRHDDVITVSQRSV
ncbi:hypothetical protein MRX96_017330 [Rhipicephalus microplus]